ENLLFRIIWAGFILLTLTLVSGVVFSEELFGRAAQFNHKTVFGVLSWIVFALLLGGRFIYGWRGRIAVRWTLAGFLMLVLAYVGSKFVLEVILGRTGSARASAATSPARLTSRAPPRSDGIDSAICAVHRIGHPAA